MLGGHRFVDLFGQPNSVNSEKLLQVAMGALRTYLRIKDEPSIHLVSIHEVCTFDCTLGRQ